LSINFQIKQQSRRWPRLTAARPRRRRLSRTPESGKGCHRKRCQEPFHLADGGDRAVAADRSASSFERRMGCVMAHKCAITHARMRHDRRILASPSPGRERSGAALACRSRNPDAPARQRPGPHLRRPHDSESASQPPHAPLPSSRTFAMRPLTVARARIPT
jgi:hypothetical protein